MLLASRRSILSVLVTGTLGGCIDSDNSEGQSRLGEVTIENHDGSRHIVDVRLTWEGEVVQERSYDIAANDPSDDQLPGVVPERTWPSERGQFELSVRIQGGSWRSFDPADYGYPDCVAIIVRIDRDGTLEIFASTDPVYCAD